MKNTVKKILALVFVVAMVCSLAVPAFATLNETISVKVIVYGRNGDVLVTETVTLSERNQNIEKALGAIQDANEVNVSPSTGKITSVKVNDPATSGVKEEKATSEDVLGKFGTGAYVVALNGKIVAEDLGNVAVEDGDTLIVYWNDSTFPTVLAQYDASNIAAGIISFYYYDAEGNKQPLTGAKVTLDVPNLLGAYVTDPAINTTAINADNGMPANRTYGYTYTTDEKGQIWIAPQSLDAETIKINSVIWTAKKLEQGNMTTEQFNYYKGIYGEWTETDSVATIDKNHQLFEARHIANTPVLTAEYDAAGATGDMTVVYVMVAFAAVATLGAVVIMKKKAVKAN